uniref:Uncharacterized protein n=1 Tax=Globodera rostochiensis TaxID=31243 RepID=A0A914HMY4_GLORO
MRNANNQNANSTDAAYDSNAEPSTSPSQNILSSEPKATSDSDSQTPPLEYENIQKAIVESLKYQPKHNNGDTLEEAQEKVLNKVIEDSKKEYERMRNNAKKAEAEQKAKLNMVMEQSAHEEALQRIAQAPASNEMPMRQKLNESDGLEDFEFEALQELINGNEEVLSKLNEKSMLKVFNAAKNIVVEESSTSAVGQQPTRENEITTRQETPNESDGLDDSEEEALEESGNEEVLSELNEKSRLKVRNVTKKLGVEESSMASIDIQKARNDDEAATKGAPAKLTGCWDNKTNQYYADLSEKSTAQQGGTLSAKKTSKEERNMLAPGDQLRQMSIDELKDLERRVKKQLEKEKVIKKVRKGNDGMPPALYDKISPSDVDRRLAKLKERSNHRDLGMHSATAQSKKGKEQKQKKGHFDKNLSESSTDSS